MDFLIDSILIGIVIGIIGSLPIYIAGALRWGPWWMAEEAMKDLRAMWRFVRGIK